MDALGDVAPALGDLAGETFLIRSGFISYFSAKRESWITCGGAVGS